MVLTRSKDKKIISLTNFNRDHKCGQYFKVLSWTNKLKKFPRGNKDFSILEKGLNEYYAAVKDTFDEFVELSFVGNSKYIQLIYFEAKKRGM